MLLWQQIQIQISEIQIHSENRQVTIQRTEVVCALVATKHFLSKFFNIYIYLYWIFVANIWGIYVTRRVSVRPSGAGLGNVHFLYIYIFVLDITLAPPRTLAPEDISSLFWGANVLGH